MRILVSGAGSELGARIALALRAGGHEVLAGRRRLPGPADERLVSAGCHLVELDLTSAAAVRTRAAGIDAAILTPILTIAGEAALALQGAGVRRGVAFSSNNVAVVSGDRVYDGLRAAEQRLTSAAPGWAVLRPTMIYGYPGDGNLSRLLHAFASWPLVPVPGSGRARQQPIHIDDLARIAAALVTGEWSASGVVPVGGPDVLTHAEMVAFARQAVGRGRPLRMPTSLARLAAALLAGRVLSGAQLDRLELDKAAVDPVDIPPALAPRIGLEQGLARLAREMDLTQ